MSQDDAIAATTPPGLRVRLSDAERDDLVLTLNGAYAPGPRYLDSREREHVAVAGRLTDGTPWALPLALRVPGPAADPGDRLLLTDGEGVPLARLDVEEAVTETGGTLLAGPLVAVRPSTEHGTAGPYRTPGQLREDLPGGFACITTERVLSPDELSTAVADADRRGLPLVVLALVGSGRARHPEQLLRALADQLTQWPQAYLVAVPLPRHEHMDAATDARLVVQVATAYGALAVQQARGRGGSGARPSRGAGVALFLTGLSGSGKSTIAKAVTASLTARGVTVTLLDGDEVRALLSAELGFERGHRDLNVRRIGFVAAEVVRHGGVAVCAPIAPYAASRRAVREMVERTGRFVLVHVATPLEICEARDRKGLYALARAGALERFTGVDDPYEPPEDADLVLDTSRTPLDACVSAVLDLLSPRVLRAGQDA